MRRLTATQYRNSINDLLGPGLTVPAIDEDVIAGGFASIGAGAVTTSGSAVARYDAAAWFASLAGR